ncbi:MAG: putative 2OG-Fe(II) oxygenase [Gammaproteobacteria bacterium]
MPLPNYDVQPLFATPIFRASLSHAITKEHIEYVKNLKMIINRDNLISENLYIFEEPELKGIKDAVQEALDVYSTEVMGLKQKLYVTQSWGLANPAGIGMHSHAHSNSLVSGSFYYAPLPEPTSRVIFDKHVMYQRLEINPLADRQNIYNTPVNVITPKEGEVLLFPSEINHMIEANQSSDQRRAIAFNCFIEGTLGNYRDVSELKL